MDVISNKSNLGYLKPSQIPHILSSPIKKTFLTWTSLTFWTMHKAFNHETYAIRKQTFLWIKWCMEWLPWSLLMGKDCLKPFINHYKASWAVSYISKPHYGLEGIKPLTLPPLLIISHSGHLYNTYFYRNGSLNMQEYISNRMQKLKHNRSQIKSRRYHLQSLLVCYKFHIK